MTLTQDYIYILIYLILAIIIAQLIIFLNIILINTKSDFEKISAYECGFTPYDNARHNFDVQFYLVGILFIIFDLEVTFLFPWISIFKQLSIFSYCIIMIFLIILTVGFVYEWMKGALSWHEEESKNNL